METNQNTGSFFKAKNLSQAQEQFNKLNTAEECKTKALTIAAFLCEFFQFAIEEQKRWNITKESGEASGAYHELRIKEMIAKYFWEEKRSKSTTDTDDVIASLRFKREMREKRDSSFNQQNSKEGENKMA